MEQENVTVLRKGYAAFASGDVPGVLAQFDSQIRWTIPGPSALAGTYEGHAGVGRFFERIAQAYDLDVRPEEFVPAGGDRVLVLGRHVGEGADGAFDVPFVHLWHVRDGKAVSFYEYTDTETFARAVRG